MIFYRYMHTLYKIYNVHICNYRCYIIYLPCFLIVLIVTGASFIVINGALKSSMGLSAKSSIVEDGLMVEIMPERMESLKAALKNMQDFSIGCGRQGASEPDETVNIKWVDNDVQFNLG